jgi:hypothetical protein
MFYEHPVYVRICNAICCIHLPVLASWDFIPCKYMCILYVRRACCVFSGVGGLRTGIRALCEPRLRQPAVGLRDRADRELSGCGPTKDMSAGQQPGVQRWA